MRKHPKNEKRTNSTKTITKVWLPEVKGLKDKGMNSKIMTKISMCMLKKEETHGSHTYKNTRESLWNDVV